MKLKSTNGISKNEKEILSMAEIKLYPIEKFIPHPGNPRKDLGDLTELADSIKAMGVLQNLIVVEEGNKLKVIAGHRRLEAAKKAGLKELPAAIRELSERQQQEMMLTENLQRFDLTLIEQAEGIQLLIDLGATVEEICQETGFSERTVYHRINIAKLDKKAIKKAEKARGEQLSLKDFILLEKVKDVKTREKLLNESGGSRDFSWHVNRAVDDERTLANTKDLEKKAIKAGMTKAEFRNSWDGGISNYKSNRYDKLKKLPEAEFYGISGNHICFYDKATKSEASAEDKKKKEREKKKKAMIKTLLSLEEEMTAKLRSYAVQFLDSAEESDKEAFIFEALWLISHEYSTYFDDGEEELLEAMTTKEDLLKFMTLHSIPDHPWIQSWDGQLRGYKIQNLEVFIKFMLRKGFEWTEEEKNLLAGIHPAQKEIKKLK